VEGIAVDAHGISHRHDNAIVASCPYSKQFGGSLKPEVSVVCSYAGDCLILSYESAIGWLSEVLTIFMIEEARAFVSNFRGSAGSIYAVENHPLLCHLQAESCLVLLRSQRRQQAKIVVQGRYAYAGN